MDPLARPPTIDADFLHWLEHQITLIRERQFAQLDLNNLLDELEFIVNSQRNALGTRVEVLITHLLKCEYQPELRSKSWLTTIYNQRQGIERLIERSPSLRRHFTLFAAAEYNRAVRSAVFETALPRSVFPDELPYSEHQLLDFDFLP